MVKFFFLIPTLNSTNNLSRLISSFQEQTYKNWRIMFVDGFSNKFHKNKMQEICSISKIIKQAHKTLALISPGLVGSNLELVAENLRSCDELLGEIYDPISSDDLLGKIFNKFCIGK